MTRCDMPEPVSRDSQGADCRRVSVSVGGALLGYCTQMYHKGLLAVDECGNVYGIIGFVRRRPCPSVKTVISGLQQSSLFCIGSFTTHE